MSRRRPPARDNTTESPNAHFVSANVGRIFWESSEEMRREFPYAPIQGAGVLLDKLAATEPQVLACMHGASYRGDGAALLHRLGAALSE